MSESFARQLGRISTRIGLQRDWLLIGLGALIGTLTGLGAVAFVMALHAAEDLSRQTQAGWAMWMLPLIPMAGALLTGLTVHLLASDARGHGVPQVMEALLRRGGRIPTRVGLAKVAASIFTVGSGGSAGAEGPIIQIGSTAGSVAGRRLGVSHEHMGTLVGCGAAAGIAAIFNAPIAGVFFVLEVLLRDFSVRTFTPIVVSSVFATATSQAVLGRNEAIFATPAQLHGYTFTLWEVPGYIVLGVLCGALAVGFSRLLHAGEQVFSRARVHPILRPVTGAALLGGLGLAFLVLWRTAAAGTGPAGAIGADGPLPAFFGNGYSTIRALLDPGLYSATDGLGMAAAGMLVVVLLALTACKAVGTTFTLGSGGSGGVFAPSLFMGATAGGAFGVGLWRSGLMPAGGTPASYALVGMAAVVAGAMHAPLTAILMLFELTRDVYVLLPIMLAAVVATVTAQLIDRDSIYTASLRKKGFRIGGARDLMLLRRVSLRTVKVIAMPPEPVYAADPLSKLVALHAYYDVPDFVVVDQSGRCVGMVTGRDMRTALVDREAVPLLLVAELLRTDLPVLHPDESLERVIEKFSAPAAADVASLPLVEEGTGQPLGLISRGEVVRRYQQVLEGAE